MALTEQQKQKKEKQKKSKQKKAPQLTTSQKLLDKVKPYIEHPFYECLMPHNLFDAGIGNILVTKITPQGEIAVCSFIVDVHCLGIKQVRFKTLALPEYEKVFKPSIMKSHGDYAFTKLKPACAKKLLEGAEEYAKNNGMSNHKDYPALKTIFGEEKLGRCWSRYKFGKDKMPFYVKGPNESDADSKRILRKLEENCGAGNFQFRL
ncbi:MAG: hypothetical protein GQ581_05320 [Methyloprofundus sp.]|nr:hypothetical protein [Methyloprofundus sp.]